MHPLVKTQSLTHIVTTEACRHLADPRAGPPDGRRIALAVSREAIGTCRQSHHSFPSPLRVQSSAAGSGSTSLYTSQFSSQ
mmetsp:Transcript_49879/g.138263  ORF Transcript_49879/g.138263 Transcript_49879/m.138263 type:complete len:81 (-) Transcript_49879:335-577(-)